jgi:hypothetical protein
MLLILIPVVWLSVAMFVVLLCRAAADGDSVLLASTERRTSSHTALEIAGSRLSGAHTWRRVDARGRASVASPRTTAGRPHRAPVSR